ncbi:MAG: TRAP transporter substrate-binding protein [Alphaproteobacteria bacterium]
MNRRMLIAAAAAVAALAALAPAVAPRAETELKLAHFLPPRHQLHTQVFVPLAEEVKKISGGKLTIRIFPAGELGKGPNEQFKRAQTGIADIAFGLAGYTSAQFPATLLIELPGVAANTVEATEQLWRVLDARLKGEFRGTKVLGLWVNDTNLLLTRAKAIKAIDDVKGLKIRVPSALAGEVVKAWGGTPVAMPVDQVYQAMDTGVVDGAYIGPSALRSFRLNEVANHLTVGTPTAFAAQYLVMNEGKWNGLSPDEKAWLEKAVGLEFSKNAARIYEKEGDSGVAAFKEKKPVSQVDAAEAAKFQAAADRVIAAHVAELERKNIPAGKILAAMKGK